MKKSMNNSEKYMTSNKIEFWISTDVSSPHYYKPAIIKDGIIINIIEFNWYKIPIMEDYRNSLLANGIYMQVEITTLNHVWKCL